MTPEATQAVAAAIAAGKPLATHTEGWSWGSIGIWFFGLVGTPTVTIALFRLIAAMRKLANERETAEDSSRLSGFKAVVDAQAAEISRLTQRIDKVELEAKAERENHLAELGLQRHATRNAKQVLYSFLDLIEATPNDAAAIAAKMRKRMVELDRQESEEAANIRGARIIAAAQPIAQASATPPA